MGLGRAGDGPVSAEKEWTPIDLRTWPDPTEGKWARSEAALEQQYGEWRIVHAQEAEDYEADQRYGNA